MRGGCCEICGFHGDPRLFDFHHLNGETKSFNIGRLPKGIGWEGLLMEFSKCALVCSICHRKLHIGEIELPENIREALSDYKVELCDLLFTSLAD